MEEKIPKKIRKNGLFLENFKVFYTHRYINIDALVLFHFDCHIVIIVIILYITYTIIIINYIRITIIISYNCHYLVL